MSYIKFKLLDYFFFGNKHLKFNRFYGLWVNFITTLLTFIFYSLQDMFFSVYNIYININQNVHFSNHFL